MRASRKPGFVWAGSSNACGPKWPERVLLPGHGHALRSLAMLWLGLPIGSGVHFPLCTGRVSILGYEKESPALVAWNVGGL